MYMNKRAKVISSVSCRMCLPVLVLCGSEMDVVCDASTAQLRNVAVHVALLALHVLLLDEPVSTDIVSKSFFPHQESRSPVNVLLDVLDIQHASAPRRLDDFRNQFRVANRLSRLHDSDHSSLTLKVSVLGNTFVRLFVLLLRLLELYLVDLDTILVVPEA